MNDDLEAVTGPGDASPSTSTRHRGLRRPGREVLTYLRFPLAWRVLGKQMLVVGRRR